VSRQIRAPITGNVWKVLTQVGQQVAEGDTLVILESMKMEIPIEAEDAGTLVEMRIQEGQAITEGDVVCVIQP
jgi:acetyl-CoA carboxylase biotin carboxyl carrier protein